MKTYEYLDYRLRHLSRNIDEVINKNSYLIGLDPSEKKLVKKLMDLIKSKRDYLTINPDSLPPALLKVL